MINLTSTIQLDVQDITDFARIREDGPRIVQQNLLLGMEAGVNDLHGTTLDLTPLCRSGKLRESLQKFILQTGRGVTGQVKSLGSVAPYNEFVHEGRGPVVAKRAKALRLTLCNGTVLYRKRVKAAPANRFLEKGLRQSEPKIVRHMEDAMGRIVSELERPS
jgi:hypothetical protein